MNPQNAAGNDNHSNNYLSSKTIYKVEASAGTKSLNNPTVYEAELARMRKAVFG